jgi:hypothetical protein
MKELSAAEITKEAIRILDTRNVEAWRQANLTYGKRKGVATKGVPDVLGFHRVTGQFVVCEVKKTGDTVKPDQHTFLSKVREAGAVALIATQCGRDVVLIEYVK